MFPVLIWLMVTTVYSSCESPLSCILLSFVGFTNMLFFTKEILPKLLSLWKLTKECTE